MQPKFIDNVLPNCYSSPELNVLNSSKGLEQTKVYEGVTYTLLGQSEKTYGIIKRIWLGIRFVIKAGLKLVITSPEKAQSDLNIAYRGKKMF